MRLLFRNGKFQMDPSAVLLANGSVRIKQTRHGLMSYNINDIFVGRSLDCYGEYSRGEVELFAQLAPPGGLVLDVGANIGALTLSLARFVGAQGAVVAFEPQRAVYQLLSANLALNEVNNVRAIHAAAGQKAGRTFVPIADHSKPGNFGGIELTDRGGEPVEIMTIDSLQLPACHFIKIDVEGQERSVIAGAAATIARFRPVLYVENDRRPQSPDLIRQLRDLDYACYWHLPPLYMPDNFYGNATNVFPGIVSIDMMCLPKGDGRTVEGMKPVTGPDDWPLP
jgi:FkbM family methyltransferase